MANEKLFTGKAENYSNARPGYSEEFFKYFKSFVTDKTKIADIGSGTGKFTKQLLNLGATVYAVEPNYDMRKECEKNLSDFDKFISVDGCDKNFNIAPESVDFITAAQAFHWFDKDAFKKECKRVLKENGSVVLIWNFRDLKDESVIENAKANEKYCPNFTGFSGGKRFDIKSALDGFFSEKPKILEFENNLFYTKEKFIKRNLSSSYAIDKSDSNYDNYISLLEKIFDKYNKDNLLKVPNITTAYIGKVK